MREQQEDGRAIWERLPGESADAYEAFCDYRAMRKGSLQVLWARYRDAAERGESVPTRRDRTLVEWSSRYRWVERRGAFVEFRRECEAEAAAQEAVRIGERQARDALMLQSVAMKVLGVLAGYDEKTGEMKPDMGRFGAIDVARLWKVGFEAERALSGQAAVIEERRVRDLSELSDAELEELVGG